MAECHKIKFQSWDELTEIFGLAIYPQFPDLFFFFLENKQKITPQLKPNQTRKNPWQNKMAEDISALKLEV